MREIAPLARELSWYVVVIVVVVCEMPSLVTAGKKDNGSTLKLTAIICSASVIMPSAATGTEVTPFAMTLIKVIQIT